MSKYDIYYSNTKCAEHHKNMELLADVDGNNKIANELGCGSGRDIVYLINKRI